jgi:hypothetical protein
MVTLPSQSAPSALTAQRQAPERFPVTAVFLIEVDYACTTQALLNTGRISNREVGNRRRVADEISIVVRRWAMQNQRKARRLQNAHLRRMQP